MVAVLFFVFSYGQKVLEHVAVDRRRVAAQTATRCNPCKSDADAAPGEAQSASSHTRNGLRTAAVFQKHRA